MEKDKLEIQRQWDQDPCGTNTVQGLKPGTLEYYRAIRAHRYSVYAPWFNELVRFNEWKSKDILEIGVGLGSDHYRFAMNGNRMVAVDLSSTHLRETIKHLILEGLVTIPIYGDAEKLPLKNECFDLVYSFGVLHHTPHTYKAIEEILRVLRPGGTAMIGMYHRNSWFYWVQTILTNGIIHRGLWRKGYKRLLSEVEYRSDRGSAMPLVKVYSRRELKRMFSGFREIEIRSCHVEESHFSYLSCFMKKVPRYWLESFLGFGGWYLMVRAVK